MSAPELWVFIPLAVVAVVGAAGLVASRNPVHSALFLLLNLLALAVIFLLLSAPLLAVLQIIVYAGAIMVLLIFVILFFVRPGQVHALGYSLPLMYALGSVLAIAVLGVLLFALYSGGVFNAAPPSRTSLEAASDLTSITSVGNLLFTRYLLPFEMTSLLLLVAMLGAVVMAGRRPDPSQDDNEGGQEESS